MAKPTYEEMLTGNTKWFFNYEDISYEMSFHGYSDYHKGTWCYYLIVPQEMYSHRWGDFKVKSSDFQIGPDIFESLDFHGGVTFYNLESYYGRNTSNLFERVKVGCDYSHLWDAEAGYPDTFLSVKLDAEATAKDFLKKNPDYNLRCRWSGVWDKKENFYESVGGWFVHKDSKIRDDYDKWKPKKEVDK